MLVSLPKNDPKRNDREKELQQARQEYVYDRSYEEILYCKEVPRRDKSDLKYWAGLGKFNLEVQINRALTSKAEEVGADLRATLEGKLKKTKISSWEHLKELVDSHVTEQRDVYEVASLNDYDRAYRILPEPLPKGRWQEDAFFAWQAIAGCNPTLIERMTSRSSKLPLTEADYQKAVGDHDTFEAALTEGRLYVADYWSLEGLTGGKTDEHQKYVWAPIALYSWQRAREGFPAALVPVAIQCGQDPEEHPIYTPADGNAWQMARTVVAVADSQDQGIGKHFGCCHMVMEAVVMAMKRQLAPAHPLRALLVPHVENTLVANDICRSSLTNVGGIVDRLQAMEISVSMKYCNDAIARFRLLESSPPQDCAARGVDDVNALPVYPHRDDQLLVWDAVETWVTSYVKLYYRTSDDVQGDEELAAFVQEMGADSGGRLQGLIVPQTVQDVIDLMARIVFRGSAYHATINYSLYDFTYAPNGPTSAFGPGPTGSDADTDSARLAMYPPYDIAYEVISIYYPLQLRLNQLGKYGGSFSDPRTVPLLVKLNRSLATIEMTIEKRNAERPVPYIYSMPSKITASIHV